MDKNIDIIHKLIDGELSPEEEKAVLMSIDTEPSLKNELNLLRKTLHIVENCDRKSAPASFTSEVIRELKPHARLKRAGLRGFFLRERVFRWNMAAAMAAMLFVVILGAGILHIQKKDNLSSSLNRGTMVTVRFNFYSPDAKSVSLAGDFNKWSINEYPMKKHANGVWTIEIPLTPRTYSYMYVIDEKVWAADPKADLYHDDGFGSKNSVVRVSTS